jgi:hypothetical protein
VQQSEIKTLLAELAQETCSFDRHQEISKMFYDAAKRRPAPDSPNDDTSMLFVAMLNKLLRVVNSKHLPGLFPFFAMICGERDGLLTFAEIDWDLMS